MSGNPMGGAPSSLNIALFASAFHPNLGGVEEVVRQTAHIHIARGENPLVVTNRWPRDLPGFEVFESIPVKRYPMRLPGPPAKANAVARATMPFIVRQMARNLASRRTGLIHLHCVSSNAWYAMRMRERLRIPLVVSLHSELTMDAGRIYEWNDQARSILRDALNTADAITAVSQQTLSDAEAFLGRELGARATVIYNGVDLSEYEAIRPRPHERRYMLGVGRLAPQKGFDLLLRAYAAIQSPAFDIVLAGDGDERGPLEDLARELGLSDRAHFVGRTDRQTTLALFQNCEFLVLPSRADEGLPMVIMECLAAGRPVAAARVGGVPEVVQDGRNGLLVPKEDVGALTTAMERMMADSEMLERFGEGARRTAQAHSWEHVADQYGEVYREVLLDHHWKRA